VDATLQPRNYPTASPAQRRLLEVWGGQAISTLGTAFSGFALLRGTRCPEPGTKRAGEVYEEVIKMKPRRAVTESALILEGTQAATPFNRGLEELQE
jgi:hypothetical protein